MIDPLFSAKLPADLGGASFRLSKGQLVVVTGDGWRAALEAVLAAGTPKGLPILEAAAGQPLPVLDGEFGLQVIGVLGSGLSDHWWSLFGGHLENYLERGGGLLLGAQGVPEHLNYTRDLARPSAGPLHDDFEQPVRSVRAGEWVVLKFAMRDVAIRAHRHVALLLSDGNAEWRSPPQSLLQWHAHLERTTGCDASFPVPAPPGRYRAVPLLDDRPLEALAASITVLPGAFHPKPLELSVNWRFTGGPPLSSRVAADLYAPRAPSRIDKQTDPTWLRGKWHQPEQSANAWLRRWTSRESGWMMSGLGKKLVIELEDNRPRTGSGDPASTLTVMIDGVVVSEHRIYVPGTYKISAQWPNDYANHKVMLIASPLWRPEDVGIAPDRRELGFLLNSAHLGDG